MLISESRLRSIIRNVLLEQSMDVGSARFTSGELGKGVEISAQDQIDAVHWALAGISVADPTIITDLVDSFIYVLEGDNESAALVIVGSAAGLGAGAAVARVA